MKKLLCTLLAMGLSLGWFNLALGANEFGWHNGFTGPTETFGPQFRARGPVAPAPSRLDKKLGDLTRWVRYWNEVAIDTSGLDHTPVAPGETRLFGEQFGPCRASRAMAIAHIAMFDALDAINGGDQSYTNIPPAPRGPPAMQPLPRQCMIP